MGTKVTVLNDNNVSINVTPPANQTILVNRSAFGISGFSGASGFSGSQDQDNKAHQDILDLADIQVQLERLDFQA